MLHSIDSEMGGVDNFRATASFAECVDGQLATSSKPSVEVYSGAATTTWTDGAVSCPANNIRVECFADPTTNHHRYPRTAHVFYSDSYGGYVCTQSREGIDGIIGSIHMDHVEVMEDGASFFDFSSDNFFFEGLGIETNSGTSHTNLNPSLTQVFGAGNVQEINAVTHVNFCLSPINGNARALEETLPTVSEEPEPAVWEEEPVCYSSFAYHRSLSTSFHDLGFDSEFGWSNSIAPAEVPYEFEIRAGANGDGKTLGNLSVDYDGQRVVVTYEAAASMELRSTRTYVGKNLLPLSGSEETVNPEHFPIVHSELSTTDTDTFEITGFSEEDLLYVVGYAVFCETTQVQLPEPDVGESPSTITTTSSSAVRDTASGLRGGSSNDQKWHSKLGRLTNLW